MISGESYAAALDGGKSHAIIWAAGDAFSLGDLPLYLALGDFAWHLIGMLERGETASLPAVFAAVERLHAEGEHYVREAATVGLLEALQNLNWFRDDW